MNSPMTKVVDRTGRWDADSPGQIILGPDLPELIANPRLAAEFPAEFLARRQTGAYCLAKRSLDVVLAIILLPILLPLFLLIAVAIKLDSQGPVLYRGERVGYLGQRFTMLKFRSMVCDADPSLHRDYVQGLMHGSNPCDETGQGSEAVYKLPQDPRITRVGRVLRATSLDELPQLVNVLRGEMSLVGPRPEVPYVLDTYQPWQWRRFQVLPGLTGLWQVSGRSKLSPSDMLRLDVEYVERCSLRLDLEIMLRTIPVLVRFDRAG